MAKGIYCYIDNENDKIVYIGKDSSINKNKRHKEHLAPSRYNAQPINRILQNNSGRYIYQVLWEIDDCTDNHLNQMEIFYIKKYDPKFNFTDGGEGISGFMHSEETRKKISKTLKGENNPNYGKTLSEETRKKMSENNARYWQGKKHSEETRKKMSEFRSKVRNTTGFYRVSKQKDNTYKQGFKWRYQYQYKSIKKSISSVDLKKLEKKVKAQNLPWKIIDDEKAQKSFLEDRE